MKKILLATVASIAAASTAFGHGVQVQLTYNPATGKLESRQVVHTSAGQPNTDPSTGRPTVVSSITRAYVIPMYYAPIASGAAWYTLPDQTPSPTIPGAPAYPSGPGITFQYDDQLLGTNWAFSGSTTQPNLSGSRFGYTFTGGLQSWVGGSLVDPGSEELQLIRSSGEAAFTGTEGTNQLTTADGTPKSLPLGNIASKSTNAHSSISFRLLNEGDAVSGTPDDGVYVLSLKFTSTAIDPVTGLTVQDSDPVYLIAYKGNNATGAFAAAGSLGFSPSQIQVVPEPASVVGLVLTGLVALRRRRA